MPPIASRPSPPASSASRTAQHAVWRGRVTQVVVEIEHAFLFVTGISEGSSLAVLATAACDPGLVAYEMGRSSSVRRRC